MKVLKSKKLEIIRKIGERLNIDKNKISLSTTVRNQDIVLVVLRNYSFSASLINVYKTLKKAEIY